MRVLRLTFIFSLVIASSSAIAENDEAASADRPRTRFGGVTLSPIVSFQPGGTYHSGRELYNGFGGHPVGILAGVSLAGAGGAISTLEVSTTAAIEASLRHEASCGSGCYDPYDEQASHRDTFLTMLLGKGLGSRAGSVELKAGLSLVFSRRRSDSVFGENSTNVAFTLGADGLFPIGRRVDVAPVLRVSYVDRRSGSRLGAAVARLGVGLRFGRSR
jgi:hypothetical protein